MSSIKGGYDLSTAIYSPEGRIFQLEYISKFIKNSPLIIGIICSDGILLLGENSKEITIGKYFNTKKIFYINSKSALAATGQPGDYTRLIERIRFEDKTYLRNFSELLTGNPLSSKFSEIIHLHTIYWHLRPFACSVILGTISCYIPNLFSILSTGFFSKCVASAIGRNSKFLKNTLSTSINLKKSCRQNLTLISMHLIKIQKNFEEEAFEILWFTKDFPTFKKPIAFNLEKEAYRKNKLFLKKVLDEEEKRKTIELSYFNRKK
ncbi:prsA7 (nucleomorph) [Hemiselmis andersenii]|uniref:PrsA7 n=1 Tax=Hemiselmis andersenii TaxID=464988 RepID=A9BL57_HEMAN|nr:prsA7 [Hemiselmis andersenii]ABW98240.1 prsA7 [Hemiselmis andersenii]|mmetsp:Transcript_26331/g.61009  ORF Transcript_26331/g.61009 Transcript_26331/m.61009 type:complete len:264 (+) Transcript_26331:881-1672(+)